MELPSLILDIRHKRNIPSISNGMLDILGKLRPVNYEWENSADRGMKGTQISFIARKKKRFNGSRYGSG